MGKNELSEAGTSMVRDNMANFRRDTRKTRVTGYPGEKAWPEVWVRHRQQDSLQSSDKHHSIYTVFTYL